MEPTQASFDTFGRWMLTRLDESLPGMSDRVCAGLKPCSHCYAGNCMDRTLVERKGVVKEACKGSGWNQIGYTRADYQALWKVLAALTELVAGTARVN